MTEVKLFNIQEAVDEQENDPTRKHRVRIRGNGTSNRTFVEEMETGLRIPFVQNYTFTQKVGEVATAVIEVGLVKVDQECDARFVAVGRLPSSFEKSQEDVTSALIDFIWENKIVGPKCLENPDRAKDNAALIAKLCESVGYYSAEFDAKLKRATETADSNPNA